MRRNYKLVSGYWSLVTGNGQSLIEVVISIALAAILAISLISTTLITQRTSQSARNNTEATKLAQEWVEQVRVFRDRHDFDELETTAVPPLCRIDASDLDPDKWTLQGGVCPVDLVIGTITFRRELSISELVPPDPNKRLLTVRVIWDEPGGQKEVKHDTVFSKWENF